MKDNGKITGWTVFNICNIPKNELRTTRPFSEEAFSSIQYYSEIKDMGMKLIESFGHTDKKIKEEIYLNFRALVRQGKAFYESAETLEHRSSPLIYYYSFLNLVKAYLCLKNPVFFTKRKILHGISHNLSLTPFEKQTIKVAKNGVFPIFYKDFFGEEIKDIELNISQLFGYLPDIAYEQILVKYGPRKFIVGLSRLRVESNKARIFLAMEKNVKMEKYKKYLAPFKNYFEKIEIEKDLAREIFDLYAEEKINYDFYQSKSFHEANPEKSIHSIRDEFIKELKFMSKFCSPVSYGTDFDFLFFFPLKKNLQIPFNDTLATYVIMFYLGSLVRYYPQYLEKLLNSKHAWLIERFVKSVGILFLRNINNLIVKRNLVYIR